MVDEGILNCIYFGPTIPLIEMYTKGNILATTQNDTCTDVWTHFTVLKDFKRSDACPYGMC